MTSRARLPERRRALGACAFSIFISKSACPSEACKTYTHLKKEDVPLLIRGDSFSCCCCCCCRFRCCRRIQRSVSGIFKMFSARCSRKSSLLSSRNSIKISGAPFLAGSFIRRYWCTLWGSNRKWSGAAAGSGALPVPVAPAAGLLRFVCVCARFDECARRLRPLATGRNGLTRGGRIPCPRRC